MKRNQICLFILCCLACTTMFEVNILGQEPDKILISAKITDAEGNPLVGAEVRSDRSRTVITTDEEGMFSMEVLTSAMILIEAENFEPYKVQAVSLVNGASVTLIKMPFHLGKEDEVVMPFTVMEKRKIVSPVYSLKTANIAKTDAKLGITEALRGRVPGLYGTNSIRGLSNPLIIVDGFTLASSSRGSDFNMLDFMDLEEIAEITVLKDASSRMLYGSEANNGAVIITSKRGESHKSTIGLRTESGIRTPISYPDYLDAADYMAMYNRASINDGGLAKYSDEDIENTRNGTDPIRYPNEEFFNSTYLNDFSPFFQLSANASGGNENARYYSRLSWYHSGDLYALEQENKSFAENNLTFRGNVDYNVNDWLSASLDAFFLIGSDREPVRNFWSDAATHLPNAYPLLIPLDMVGDETLLEKARIYDGNVLGGTNQYKNNIYGNFVQGGFRTPTTRMSRINTGFDFDLDMITEGLTAQIKFNYDILSSYILSYNHEYAVYEPRYVPATGYEGDSLTLTKIGLDRRNQSQGLSNPMAERRLGILSSVNYNRVFAEKHNISAMATGYWSHYDVMADFYTNKYNNFGLNANYMYDNRIVLNLTGILTGSGYLPGGDRYRISPSVGLGWIVSEESFLSGNNVVNYLKVKVNYGTLLTDDGMPDRRIYASTFSSSGSLTYNQGLNSNSGKRFSNFGNPGISFISRNDFNIGIESMLAGKRIWVEASYFKSLESGVITKRSDAYPSYIPVLQYENYEKYSDAGFDAGFTINEKLGDFHFSFGGNLVYVVPKAVRIDEPEYINAPYRQLQGQPYDAIFGYEAIGLFRDTDEIAAHASQVALGAVIPGDIKYKDLNDDGKIDENDLKIIGYSRARLGYGINLTLKYDKFSLFVLGTGQGGSQRIFSNSYYWQVGQTAKYSVSAMDYWTPETANTATKPILHLNAADNNFRNSTYWIENNNWFSLHTIQLTYRMKSTFANNVQVYIRGHNLATISPIKDKLELNIGSAPQMRTYAAGLVIMF